MMKRCMAALQPPPSVPAKCRPSLLVPSLARPVSCSVGLLNICSGTGCSRTHAYDKRMQSFYIRDICSADVPRLASIEEQCSEFSAGWSAADITAELSNSLSRSAVAASASSDEPLGYVVCWLVAGELQVLECAVDPAHQSQGIGRALLTHMLQTYCHPQGAVLEVKAHNARAVRLYQHLGFVEVGRRPRFYPCGSDALLMARSQPEDELGSAS